MGEGGRKAEGQRQKVVHKETRKDECKSESPTQSTFTVVFGLLQVVLCATVGL